MVINKLMKPSFTFPLSKTIWTYGKHSNLGLFIKKQKSMPPTSTPNICAPYCPRTKKITVTYWAFVMKISTVEPASQKLNRFSLSHLDVRLWCLRSLCIQWWSSRKSYTPHPIWATMSAHSTFATKTKLTMRKRYDNNKQEEYSDPISLICLICSHRIPAIPQNNKPKQTTPTQNSKPTTNSLSKTH